MFIENINSNDLIKKLSIDELNVLSDEVRNYIIDVVSNNGGHLASSLGVVELTVAILKVFDMPNDKIVWDVGHQSYAYKILTDRYEKFKTLRKYKGISGFPKRNESIYDSFDTGHSSTSISAGLGMCVARDMAGKDFNVISVIGDGALTGGMAFEALNNVSTYKNKFIIILNDNNMSISKSIGGITHALLGIRTSLKYRKTKQVLKKFFEAIPCGIYIKNFLIVIVNIIKQIFVSNGMLFENMDINYLGPIDGHNIKDLIKTLSKAKMLDEPVVIHVKTKKGKGYNFAENNPTKFHGIQKFDKITGELTNLKNNKTYSNVFENKIVEIADQKKEVIAISAAMIDGVGLNKFKIKYPNRVFDVGISEQHAVTFAAGIATMGYIPVVAIYSTFLQRAFDQIIHDVAIQNLHVVFAIDRAGIVGEDGETHQGIFDISYMNLIPNMTIMAPKSAYELEKMLEYAIFDYSGPIAIRYPRGESFNFKLDNEVKIEHGISEIIYTGEKIAIIAYGSMVKTAINIYKHYNENITVVNLRFINPIDYNTIDNISNTHNKIVILEENVLNGSIGVIIKNYILNKYKNKKVINLSIPNRFISHGKVQELLEECNLTEDKIINIINNNE